MKTKTVTFSYGTVKDASLEVPAEACSLFDIAHLIQQSFFKYMFRPGCGLMSDEVLVSSIGQANFFAGALGGYETRLNAKDFEAVKDMATSPTSLAVGVVEFRNPNISHSEKYMQASKNEALSKIDREALAMLSTYKF